MEREEFARRVQDAEPMLYNVARGILRNPSDCGDVVQEAVLRAWAALPSLRDESKLESWLVRILQRECYTALRRRKRETPVERLPEHPASVDSGDLHIAMDSLGTEDARLIRMHHEQGYPIHDIAAMLQMEESLVKVRLFRARKKLRVILIALLIAMMLGGLVAVATGHLDVIYFFTKRGAEQRNEQQLHDGRLSYIQQSSTLTLLNAQVTSAAWVEDDLAVTVAFSVSDPKNHIALPQEAIGVDGESFDKIWWDGKIYPLADWLPKDKTPVLFRVEAMQLGEYEDLSFDYDWLQEGASIAYMFMTFIDEEVDAPGTMNLTLTVMEGAGLDAELPRSLG